jgi:hypothetical protein
MTAQLEMYGPLDEQLSNVKPMHANTVVERLTDNMRYDVFVIVPVRLATNKITRRIKRTV